VLLFLLMVVDYLDFVRIAIAPYKANPPLVINADAVLSFPVPAHLLQSIAGRRRQIAQFRCAVQLSELASRDRLNCAEATAWLPSVKPFGVGTTK